MTRSVLLMLHEKAYDLLVSFIGPLLFSLYTELLKVLSSMRYISTSVKEVKIDLKEMNNLLFQWKLIFILKDNRYSYNIILNKKVTIENTFYSLKHKNISRKILWLQEVKINVDENGNVLKMMFFFWKILTQNFFFESRNIFNYLVQELIQF